MNAYLTSIHLQIFFSQIQQNSTKTQQKQNTHFTETNVLRKIKTHLSLRRKFFKIQRACLCGNQEQDGRPVNVRRFRE